MAESVTITLVLTLKPEAVAGFSTGLKEMLGDTKKFSGCLGIRVLQNKADPNQLIFIEEWQSEDDYGKYIAWRTGRGDMDTMASALSAPPKMDVWPTVVAS